MSFRKAEMTAADEAKRTLRNTSVFAVIWFFSTFVCLVEAFLAALKPSEDLYILELILLAASTFLFCLGILGTICCVSARAFNSGNYLDMFDAELGIEFLCLLIGWVAFFANRNVATLRCLRLYRYACYYDVFPPEARFQQYNLIEYFFWSIERIAETLHVKKWVVHTAASFYVTYIMGVVFKVRDLGTFEHPDLRDLSTATVLNRVLEVEQTIKTSWLYQSITDRALIPILTFVAILAAIAVWELFYSFIHESPHIDIDESPHIDTDESPHIDIDKIDPSPPVTESKHAHFSATTEATTTTVAEDMISVDVVWKDSGGGDGGYDSGNDTPKRSSVNQKLVIEGLKAELKKHTELLEEHSQAIRQLTTASKNAASGLKGILK